MTHVRTAGARRAATAILALFCLALLTVSPTLAAKPQGSPGNNGTVKVHDGATEPDPAVRNQPHVCTFHLDFFFGDAGQSGDWWIESWSPAGDRSEVLAGSYATDGSGGDRQPDAGTYSLPNGHYKLYWEGDENPGGNTNLKHKVFWVECDDDDPTDPNDPNDPPQDQ